MNCTIFITSPLMLECTLHHSIPCLPSSYRLFSHVDDSFAFPGSCQRQRIRYVILVLGRCLMMPHSGEPPLPTRISICPNTEMAYPCGIECWLSSLRNVYSWSPFESSPLPQGLNNARAPYYALYPKCRFLAVRLSGMTSETRVDLMCFICGCFSPRSCTVYLFGRWLE